MANAKKRGRPRCVYDVDLLRTMAWYHWCEQLSGLPVPMRIELLVSDDHFWHRDIGGYAYPGIFAKYRNGKKNAGKYIVNKTELKIKGSRYWYDHPLWLMAASSIENLEKLYSYAHCSSFSLLQDVFSPIPIKRLLTNQRPYDFRKSLEIINKQSDAEALTACLGLIHEARILGNKLPLYDLKDIAFKIFQRAISEPPLCHIAKQLFDYLNLEFFSDRRDISFWEDYVREIDIENIIDRNSAILRFIKESGLLKNHIQPPLACLYLAEQQLPPPILNTIINDPSTWHRNGLHKSREVKGFVRALRKWENSQISPIRNHHSHRKRIRPSILHKGINISP